MRYLIAILVIVSACTPAAVPQQPQPTTGVDLNTGASYPVQPTVQPPPREWIDKDTGHRVVRLTDEPNSQSLYFHQNAFSPDGTKMVFTSPTGIYQVDLTTRKIELILGGDATQSTQGSRGAHVSVIVAGRKTGRIFFTRSVSRDPNDPTSAARSVWWIDPVTKAQHEIGLLPRGVNIGTVNCDETLLAGAITYMDGRGGAATRPARPPQGQRISLYTRWAQHLPMALLTMNVQTGQIKTFNPSNDWDNHFQFSPTDPNLLMYCHEGPWHLNDRIWIIRTDGTGLMKVHQRTMINEIWGHEFWSADGRTIWYQLQTPRGFGGVGWIAGYNLDTGRRTWYHDAPDTESIHVNVSRDGSLFAGDGISGSPWIFLFRPILDQNLAPHVYDSSHLIQPGYLLSERLVNMSNHHYALEPNPIFTPDMKWIIFRSNMFGPSYAFAVEVAKAR